MSDRPIWVIEDNDLNFELVEFLLGEAGHRVVRARDLSELPRLVAGEPPALVLLDMNLPSGSGLELVSSLRRIPGAARSPIIALTAHAMSGDEERALEAGCDAYLSKPISPKKVVAEVQRLLEGAGKPPRG